MRIGYLSNEQPSNFLEASPCFLKHQSLGKSSPVRIMGMGQMMTPPGPTKPTPSPSTHMQMSKFRVALSLSSTVGSQTPPHSLLITSQLGPGLHCPCQKSSSRCSGPMAPLPPALWPECPEAIWAVWPPGPVPYRALESSQQGWQNMQTCLRPGGRGGHLLGTRLMARRGRNTRTVRMAERLTLCPSREYSIILGEGQKKGGSGGGQVPKLGT